MRERDRQRFAAQLVGGIAAGRDLLLSNAEEQARESGAVSGPSTPVMLEKEPRKGFFCDGLAGLPELLAGLPTAQD